MCVKHIYENLKKKHLNKDLLKPMIWSLAWSYNPVAFKNKLKDMKDYNISLHDDVMKVHPNTWSRAFYKVGSCCEDVDNNATESFNATITKARAKEVVPMLETIRRQAMERIVKREKKSSRHQKRFTPYVCKLLELQKKDAEKCKTYTATTGLFDVEVYGNSYSINITRKTCSCGKWQLTCIPCEHAYGAMLDESLNVEDFVSKFFLTFVWQETYKSPIIPMRGPRFWMKLEVLLIKPLPGRKKNKKQTKFPRKNGKHESPTKGKHLGDQDALCIVQNAVKVGTTQQDASSFQRKRVRQVKR